MFDVILISGFNQRLHSVSNGRTDSGILRPPSSPQVLARVQTGDWEVGASLQLLLQVADVGLHDRRLLDHLEDHSGLPPLHFFSLRALLIE